MERVRTLAVVGMGLALFSTPLAAQSSDLRPAGDSVEVEIAAVGSARIAAQGFRFSAFLPRQAGGEAIDVAQIVRRLVALETTDREVCSPTYPLGFIGNPAFAEAEALEEGLGNAQPATEAGEDGGEELPGIGSGWGAYPQLPHTGLLPSAAALESARAILAEHGLSLAIVLPVLFDCTAANEQSRLNALTASVDEAGSLARALGMRVGGVTRIASGADNANLFGALAGLSAADGAEDDTVEVMASLRVTYRLDR